MSCGEEVFQFEFDNFIPELITTYKKVWCDAKVVEAAVLTLKSLSIQSTI